MIMPVSLPEIITRQCFSITSGRHFFKTLSPGLEKSNRIYCLLSAGLTGRFCEINIDDCEEKPCGTLSICNDALGGYVCFCAPGFIGK